MQISLRSTAGRAVATTAVAFGLVLAAIFLSPTGAPHVERHWTQEKSIVFDYANARGETKTMQLALDIGSEGVDGATRAQLSLPYRFETFAGHPGNGQGTLACKTQIFVNGEPLGAAEHVTYAVFGDDHPPGDDRVVVAETTYPSVPGKGEILERLVPSSDNRLEAATSCTSHVTATGPTIAIVTFGSLQCLVTT